MRYTNAHHRLNATCAFLYRMYANKKVVTVAPSSTSWNPPGRSYPWMHNLHTQCCWNTSTPVLAGCLNNDRSYRFLPVAHLPGLPESLSLQSSCTVKQSLQTQQPSSSLLFYYYYFICTLKAIGAFLNDTDCISNVYSTTNAMAGTSTSKLLHTVSGACSVHKKKVTCKNK